MADEKIFCFGKWYLVVVFANRWRWRSAAFAAHLTEFYELHQILFFKIYFQSGLRLVFFIIFSYSFLVIWPKKKIFDSGKWCLVVAFANRWRWQSAACPTKVFRVVPDLILKYILKMYCSVPRFLFVCRFFCFQATVPPECLFFLVASFSWHRRNEKDGDVLQNKKCK